ncbi:MAG TPA: membrane protein insertase YidC [Gammaproteobacteria bacterium]|nr:membrane protein insertase YidC [Gammaproteobacteria bacterium]
MPAPAASGETTRTNEVPAAPVAQQATGPAVSGVDNKIEGRQRITVRTDVFHLELDTLGGDIRVVDLLAFPVDQKQPDKPFRLMTDTGAHLFVAQTGFAVNASSKGMAPDHNSLYQTSSDRYAMQEGKDTLTVELYWQSDNGIKVTKQYLFHRGRYDIELKYIVENNSTQSWDGSFYRQMQRTHYADDTSPMFIKTYMGGVIYTTKEKYEKITFSDMQDASLLVEDVKDGWVSMMQHYFLGAWIPAPGSESTFYTRYLKDKFRYLLGVQSALVEIAPGKHEEFTSIYYIGPKDQHTLATLAPGLELTVDYGVLTVIAKPLFWLMTQLHGIFGNWGWSIIFLTLIVKLVFYKLSETSYRSMANMRRLQPRLKALKERHGDDRQAMNQSMMEIYKKEKINPLGGCLPILVQIPVFIALYWVLLESIELRQAPFILWIKDLSSQDPYYVLPVLMGTSMFLQQRLNPQPLDPMQAKIMSLLPIIFTVFFLFFPSGLVLYWVVNNSLSILQQWVITKRIAGNT